MFKASEQPLVTVILASYNHEAFIEAAIHSVLNQTHQNVQLIVADDGSSDKTAKVAQSIKDSRLKVIALKENRRVHPRNTGLAHAKGEYVAIQNSDDIWALDKLEKQVAYMEAHSKTGVVFTGVGHIDENDQVLENSWASGLFQTENKTRIEWLKHLLLKGNCFCISSAMIRKSVLDKVGLFDESLVQLSDYDLWIRALGISDVHIIAEKLTIMRLVADKNLSTPTPIAVNRSIYEWSQVLMRYAEEPLIKQMGQILPGKFRALIPLKILQQGRLIQKCWKLTPAHLLFALNLGDSLLRNPKNRQLLTFCFGARFVKDHYFMKGQLQLGIVPEFAAAQLERSP